MEKYGELCKQNELDKLSVYEASFICYNVCVTPCSAILALIYLERLRDGNPQYLGKTASSQVFLVSLVSSAHVYSVKYSSTYVLD